MENIIEVKNLSKNYNNFKAVDNVSFDIKKGEIFGLLGPNGAGKTTIIRMLIGILKPAQGKICIGEYDIQQKPIKARQILGIVPEMANAYIDLSAKHNLLLMGELYGIAKNKRIEKAENLLKLFQLDEKKNQKVKTFSKGMQQRIVLAMALMNDSEILFLDEPTSGLDVESVRLIRGLIKKFNQEGKTILLTTHNIEEANLLCHRVAIMNQGQIVAIDRPEKLKQIMQNFSSIEVALEKEVELNKLKFKDTIRVEQIGDKFRFYTQEPHEVISALVKYTEKSKNKIISLKTLTPSLEDVFVKLTEAKK